MARLIYYGILLGLYYFGIGALVLDGYTREILGHQHGHGHSKLHRVLWQWTSGSHINPNRSYGDEKRLKKTASNSTRATPEGSIVYWSKFGRGKRALRNNGISVGILSLMFWLLVAPKIVVQVITVTLILAITGLTVLLVRKLRTRTAGAEFGDQGRLIKADPALTKISMKGTAHPVMHVSPDGTVIEGKVEKPTLEESVPQKVLSILIAGPIGISSAEAGTRLKLTADRGLLVLPDHFAALQKDRATVEEIIQAQTASRVAFTWATSSIPRTVSWVPIVTNLPRDVPFREWIPKIEALRPGEFGLGIDVNRTMYVASHNGDTPWHLRSCGSGTGKSRGFLVKTAQVCHRDPAAEVYCVDTKQVSFENLHGIKGVHIYDDPEAHMADIWKVFYVLEGLMRDRYTAVRKKEARPEEFDDIWLFVDEGNDLAGQLKTYYQQHIKERTDPAQPTIWTEAIAPLINLGRQVGIRGEFMFQNMTDRVLGGVSLRDSFGIVGMAGYKKNQWTRIIGTSPVPELKNGPGRICMVKGPDQTWIQGFNDDPDFLRGYALAGRGEGKRNDPQGYAA